MTTYSFLLILSNFLHGYTIKKVTDFPVPSMDVKLSLSGKNLIIPSHGEFG
jgi:hypothetical protein